MKRLTAWNNGHAYFPQCFKDPCNGCGCVKENCDFLESVCRRLAEYEDTGHTPSMIRSLKKSEINAHRTAIQHAMKLADYEKIGTLEECREAVERQKARKPIKRESDGIRYTDSYRCPSCDGSFCGTGIADYCYHCGQRILWEE